MNNPQPVQPPSSFWRSRDYMLLWSGQIVSATGTSASQIAFPLLILALTGSAAQAGIVGGLQLLPYLFLSLPAGVLIDRWDRKRVMILCDTVRCLNMATVPLAQVLGHLSLPQLYAVALVEGSFFVFFDLAEVAALPRIVGREQLPAATAQNQIVFMVAGLAGPPLGGFLYGAVGRVVPFLADAVSYAGSALSLTFIRTRFQAEREVSQRSMKDEMLEGVRWLGSHRLLRFLAAAVGAANFITGGGLLVLIVLARNLHASPAITGLILSVAAIGGLTGALIAPRLQRRFSFGQAMIGSSWAQAALAPLLIFAPNPAVLALCTAVLFVTFPISTVVLLSYRLTLIPDALQGRVNSAFRLMAYATVPAGMALSGVAIQLVGARATLAIMTGGLIVVAAAISASREVRSAPRLDKHESSTQLSRPA